MGRRRLQLLAVACALPMGRYCPIVWSWVARASAQEFDPVQASYLSGNVSNVQ